MKPMYDGDCQYREGQGSTLDPPSPSRASRDAAERPLELGTLQRARGTLSLSFRRRGSVTCLADLRQEGCLKARFPRPHDGMQAITLNTSGGVASGDVLQTNVLLQAGAAATITSQAAERFYRALPGDAPATLCTDVVLESAAALDWLPQEGILFDASALDRRLSVEMAADATFLGVESLVFGRAAMGERLRTTRLRDTIRVRRAGVLILHDAVRPPRDIGDALSRPAIAAGARAVATILLVAPDAAAGLDALRAALAAYEAGASAWNGLLLARILAPDAAVLRRAVVAGLDCLRGGRILPRAWMC